jgi:hypothetical protein
MGTFMFSIIFQRQPELVAQYIVDIDPLCIILRGPCVAQHLYKKRPYCNSIVSLRLWDELMLIYSQSSCPEAT